MQFSKMHSLGNDFIIIDAINQNINLSPEIIRHLSDRYYGIGFDQLLIVEPSSNTKFDFHYRIFNADGNEVGQCANGARCFANFVHMKKLTNKRDISISTKTGQMILSIIYNNLIRVNMGEPNFHSYQLPFYADKIEKTYAMYLIKNIMLCDIVSIGNLHCVIIVDNIDNIPVKILGEELQRNNIFSEQANIGFMQIVNRKHLRLRVYERGVGETKSCGSGACAAAAVGISQGLLAKQVQVEFLGGCLSINWMGPGYPLYMTGPSAHVYDGLINL